MNDFFHLKDLIFACFALCLGFETTYASETEAIVFWHNQDSFQKKILQELVDQFSKKNKVKIVLESGVDLEPALFTQIEANKAPDIVMAPSNFVSLKSKIELSQIPAAFDVAALSKRALETVTVDGKLFGIPILSGNHLLLFYNKKLIADPAKSWQQLITQKKEKFPGSQPIVAFDLGSAYNYFSFFLSFGGYPLKNSKINLDGEACRKALGMYKTLISNRIVPSECGYTCVTEKFYRGDFPYAINGDWDFEESEKALGRDFSVARLPAFEKNKKMLSFRATHAMFFPNDSLKKSSGPLVLKLAKHLVSKESQIYWMEQGRRIPTFQGLEGKRIKTDLKVVNEQLKFTKSIPLSNKMDIVWRSVSKGLRFYLQGLKNETETCQFMQKMANSYER